MRVEKYVAAVMLIAMVVILAVFGAAFVAIAGGQHALQQGGVSVGEGSRVGDALFEAQRRAGLSVLVRSVPPVALDESRLNAFPGTGHGARLVAAQACWVEAGFQRSDCSAMLYVARARAARVHRPWVRVLRAYSAIHGNGPRAVEARAFPWADIRGKSVAFNAQWAALREHVCRVLAGLEPDPCHATHWGSPAYHTDAARIQLGIKSGVWRVVQCTQPTANVFLAEVAP